MNTLDDLTTSLDAYAQRDTARGAAVVWAEATDAISLAAPAGDAPGPRRRPLVALAAVAAGILIVAALALVRHDGEVGLATIPTPDSVPAAPVPALPAIAVPDGIVRDVVVGVGRIWAVTDSEPIQGETRLRSYDRTTGEQLSDLPIAGTAQEVVATDTSIFVRLARAPDLPDRTDGGRPWSAAVLRIDPSGGTVVATIPLAEEGPIAAYGSRVAFSDASELHVHDDATGSDVQIAIPDAVGHDNVAGDASSSAEFGFTGLALGPDGLFGKYARGNELVQMDPATGAHVATQVVEDGAQNVGPWLAASDGYLWTPGGSTVYGVATPIATPPDLPAERRIDVGATVSEVAPVAGGRFTAVLADQALVAGPSGDELRTTLDRAATSRLVEDQGQPWVAQWQPSAAPSATVVSFVRVRTDASMPAGAPPATPAPASIVLMADRPLRDGDFAAVVLAGLPPGTDVTVQACLVAPDAGDVCAQRIEPDPLPTVHVDEAVHEDPLITGWSVRRSIYDTRWHDCGVEACELRVYPVGADGRVDRSSILARTPLSFEGSGAIIRPSLRRADGAAIQPGDTVTVLGEDFPPGATIRLRLCPTGPQTADCVDDGGEAAGVATDGTVELRFTVPSTTLGRDGSIDCTSGRGVCMFAVFPDEQSIETYAATLLDFVPVDVGTVPGTMPH